MTVVRNEPACLRRSYAEDIALHLQRTWRTGPPDQQVAGPPPSVAVIGSWERSIQNRVRLWAISKSLGNFHFPIPRVILGGFCEHGLPLENVDGTCRSCRKDRAGKFTLARHLANRSQESLARHAGVRRSYVLQIEAGQRALTESFYVRVMHVLQLPPWEFFNTWEPQK